MKTTQQTTLILFALGLAFGACGPDFSSATLGDEVPFEPDRPTFGDTKDVPAYTGVDPFAIDAQERYRTGLDIQRKIIYRTCTPFDGVCHNKKEYPDLHTNANFINTIDAPCNITPGDFTSVFDRCEPSADRVQMETVGKNEVAYLINVEGTEENADGLSPGLHLYLANPLEGDREEWYDTARFIRDIDGVDVVVATFETRWARVDATHVVGEVPDYLSDEAADLVESGINEGDKNRNGVFGTSMGPNVKMLVPGDPEESYLIARIRGEIGGEPIPGSRMPLANQPLDITDMLALFCFVEGMDPNEQPDLRWPIDYNNCSYADDPEGLNLLGEGVTWTTRVSKVFEANCGGCHYEGADQATGGGLDLLSEGAYSRLLVNSTQDPTMPLITPGDPENSYLWLKLIDDDTIVGNPMPYNPLTGEGELREAELGDVQTWIINGATENE